MDGQRENNTPRPPTPTPQTQFAWSLTTYTIIYNYQHYDEIKTKARLQDVSLSNDNNKK